jgi:carboxymethylenebutenolidase
MSQKDVEYTYPGGKTTKGLLVEAEEPGPRGSIVLVHEWWGLNAHVKDLAQRFAREGFDVLAPDFYDGNLPSTEGDAAKAMNALDLLDAVARIDAGAAFLRARERSNGKVGVTGFCLGGAITFAAACHVPGLAGFVPFYGTPTPEKVDWSKVDAPIEAHFAKRDQWATVEKAEAIQKTLVEHGKSMVLHVYDAEHAFVNDTRPVYHAENAKLAWERTVAFFRRVL